MGRTKGSKDSKPRKRRTRADAPGAEALNEAGIGHNSDKRPSRLTQEDETALFMHHREKWTTLQNKQKLLDEQWVIVKANLKADGFAIAHMRIADDLKTPKGEKKQVSSVTDRLWVARMIGHAMGRQYDLFEQPAPAANFSSLVGDVIAEGDRIIEEHSATN